VVLGRHLPEAERRLQPERALVSDDHLEMDAGRAGCEGIPAEAAQHITADAVPWWSGWTTRP
jgi:hypothetical protein